eukprot:COSAG02_NODE_6166_length_3754_cov_34.198906_3_plen_290_part_00
MQKLCIQLPCDSVLPVCTRAVQKRFGAVCRDEAKTTLHSIFAYRPQSFRAAIELSFATEVPRSIGTHFRINASHLCCSSFMSATSQLLGGPWSKRYHLRQQIYTFTSDGNVACAQIQCDRNHTREYHSSPPNKWKQNGSAGPCACASDACPAARFGTDRDRQKQTHKSQRPPPISDLRERRVFVYGPAANMPAVRWLPGVAQQSISALLTKSSPRKSLLQRVHCHSPRRFIFLTDSNGFNMSRSRISGQLSSSAKPISLRSITAFPLTVRKCNRRFRSQHCCESFIPQS